MTAERPGAEPENRHSEASVPQRACLEARHAASLTFPNYLILSRSATTCSGPSGATRSNAAGSHIILVFGSINVDLSVPVPYLPHPGETVLGGEYALLPGGKGANQALAACRAGSEAMLAGAVGSDSFATVALGLLRHNGVDLRLVRIVERPSGCAAIMVSSEGENAIAVAPGANASVHAGQVPDERLDRNTIL